ncbi:phage portal protein [Corynebacterium striatum]
MGIVNDVTNLLHLMGGRINMPVAPADGDTGLQPATIDAAGVSLSAVPAQRENAMQVPAIMRARNLICTTAALCELKAVRLDDSSELETQPSFITRTDRELSPFHRALWTADDLLFYGWSLWQVTRDYDGQVITADRVDYSRWQFQADGTITIDGHPAAAASVILIPGIHEGILEHGGQTIREASALMRGVTRAVETPQPVTELHQTNHRVMSEQEATELKKSWIKARQAEGGGIAVTSAGIEVKHHGAADKHLLIEGRNAVATDIARLCGIPAPMIDASISGTSMSYSNTQSRMAELITFGVAPIISAIAARLSQNDVLPLGKKFRVDVDTAVSGFAAIPESATGLVDTPPAPRI